MIPTPFNEKHRLSTLEAYEVLDTEPELGFDRITRLASRHFQVPIALVSLVDDRRQWFKSRVGLDVGETMREISFCGHAIMNDHVMQIPDARRDPRFADSPLVTGEPNIRFYAGAPLISPDGFRVGTLCLIDREPREPLHGDDLEVLTDLADMVVEQLELGRRMRDLDAERVAALRDLAEMSASRDGHRGTSGDAQLDAIAGMAHELRTPLNAIMGLTQIVEGEIFGRLDPRYLVLADSARKNSEYLLDLVNDILDFAYLKTGEIPLKEQDIDIAEIAGDCVAMLAEQAGGSKLRLDTSLPSRLPRLRADSHRLMQMLINLVGNGIKYTPAGGTVRIGAEARPDGGLSLSVTDTGIGIPADARLRVLTPFCRLQNDATEKREGCGLGLPLTQRMVEMHGGFLTIDAAAGGGTVVGLHFPPHRVVR